MLTIRRPMKAMVRPAVWMLGASALLLIMQPLAAQTSEPPTAAPREEPREQPHITATNNLDPEHPAPIVGWWSNGEQLLEVAPDSSYRIYATQNRYRKSIENGRWNRQNHAAFWLEPYTRRKEERSRVALSLVGETPVISLRKYKAMRLLSEAPLTEEDMFIGLWAGAGGSLELANSMRYRFVAPRSSGEGPPVVISSHRGQWRLKDGHVEVLPDSPSVAALIFVPEMDGAPQAASVPAPAPAPVTPSAEPPPGAGVPGPGVRGAGVPQTDPYEGMFMRLRGVEGILERVIERPMLGPDSARPAVTGTPTTPTTTPAGSPSGG